MKTIKSICLFFLLQLSLQGQINTPIRIAIGDSLLELMTVRQVTSKPFFKAYHPRGTPNFQYRITKLTLVIKSKTEGTKKYQLQETIMGSNSQSDPVKVTAPKLEKLHLEIIKKLKPGDKLKLDGVTILPPDAGATVISDTEITIR